ncbi:MAG: valine--tRNA ligase [Candidatus Tectomicrobia bacterium]|nr:valine--tRNA ligase [Candidatus Tectomicrobia bacterium]
MLNKQYEPRATEERWLERWLASGAFHGEDASARPAFCIVIPPPNVTGSLHMGHALNNTLQDILARWKRMGGHNTAWIPGTDHAGIATQNVVERSLAERGVHRRELGREAFVEEVWKWREEYGRRILHQLKRLGASCDWDRERFTLDEGLSRAVLEAFVSLYEEGLIYRGERLVNWCPRCGTALSDVEVEYEEVAGRLWYVRYPSADDPSGGLIIATTRPETMLGDTAVAVHPEDERYREWVGRNLIVPGVGRVVPVVADAYVSRDFGTGALKVTPAHDPNDYEIGERHSLTRIKAFTADGRVSEALSAEGGRDPKWDRVSELVGLTVQEARGRMAGVLKELSVLVQETPHGHAVGHCYRCDTVVEPFLTPQWFVRTQPLAQPAMEAVEDGRIRILPEGWAKTYFEWMRNIRDWCISRQIWWGHQIPAWYCLKCNQGKYVPAGDENGEYIFQPDAVPIVSRGEPRSCPQCGGEDLLRDPDVLDTWFSSALWPFSTLGWPERTDSLRTFYPTSALVTAFDILFFWVARMIMMGLKLMGDVPFRDVYIHALVRDEQGRKMSKSLKNIIDPLDVIEQYGTDAFRFTLAALAAQGREVRFQGGRIEGYRNFCNKLWNAARYSLSQLEPDPQAGEEEAREAALSAVLDKAPFVRPADRWILSALHRTAGAVQEALSAYKFNEAAHEVYQFVWHRFCDWYLEETKPRLASGPEAEKRFVRAMLTEVLDATLRLLHPLMPFITEEIWSQIPRRKSDPDLLALAAFPSQDPRFLDPRIEEGMELLTEAISRIWNMSSENNIHPRKKIPLRVRKFDGERAERGWEIFEAEKVFFFAAANIDSNSFVSVTGGSVVPSADPSHVSATDATAMGEWTIPLNGLIEDVAAEKERVTKQLKSVQKDLERLEKNLSNPSFRERAPAEVIAENEARRAEALDRTARLKAHLARLDQMEGAR